MPLNSIAVKPIVRREAYHYASKQIIRQVREKGFHFVSFLKSNRRLNIKKRTTTIRRYIQRHVKKARKQSITIDGSRYRTRTTLCHLAGIGTVRVVFSQKKGRNNILTL